MIRLILGFILTLGGVGAMETSTEILPGLSYAVIGLAIAASAIPKLNRQFG